MSKEDKRTEQATSEVKLPEMSHKPSTFVDCRALPSGVIAIIDHNAGTVRYEPHIEKALDILGWRGGAWTNGGMIKALVAKIEAMAGDGLSLIGIKHPSFVGELAACCPLCSAPAKSESAGTERTEIWCSNEACGIGIEDETVKAFSRWNALPRKRG